MKKHHYLKYQVSIKGLAEADTRPKKLTKQELGRAVKAFESQCGIPGGEGSEDFDIKVELVSYEFK